MPLRTPTHIGGVINLRRLGQTIADRRREMHLTQVDLAKRTQRHQADISRLERGLNEPTLQTLANIAHVLQMDTLELIARAFD